ncbi:MAG TPA: 1-(5-phosphoribosyl)-5-[(5-phosphoribosylamino)methylideneamino] imidazole-4-carboxamide isomerase [Candidatus Dormibacteraeota bacterium]|nr:1-(5-phosphoribosyl)-5-[(5-phosphoribosylamino)methylideneamino] imidazole-4-carboxamide isomerase [Candidatus Dormibacteraeota bacterium]
MPRIVPALDLRAGRVVRLGEHGDFASERAFADGPDAVVALAHRYVAAGAGRLHVVDLDAARGSGDNRTLVGRLVTEAGAEVQVSGGVRSLDAADEWLRAGAAAVVMGTAAVRDPALLAAVAAAHPGRVLAALDVRGGRPALTGWAELADLTAAEALDRWAGAPLAGLVVTSVDRDGTLGGPDLALLAEVSARSAWPVTYSGGVSSLADVRAVAAAGAAAVILGRSLLEGRISLAEALALS